jgi:hypothetical protein
VLTATGTKIALYYNVFSPGDGEFDLRTWPKTTHIVREFVLNDIFIVYIPYKTKNLGSQYSIHIKTIQIFQVYHGKA